MKRQTEIIDKIDLYRVLIDQPSIPFAIKYPDGKIKYTNHAFNDLLGYDDDDLKKIEYFNKITPKKWHRLEKDFNRSIEKGGRSGSYEKEYVKKDGSIIPVELLVHPSYDKKGKLKYFYAFITDLTDRKKADQALIESEHKYRTLFDNAADGILIMQDDIIVECNRTCLDIYKVTLDEIIGKTPYFFSPTTQLDGKNSKEKCLDYIYKALAGVPQHFEWKHIYLNGTPFYTEISLNRFKIEEKYFIQALIRDITDRKNTEARLKDSENRYRMVGEILSDFAYSCMHNTSGIYEYEWITDSFYNITGHTPEELEENRCWLFTIHPEDEKLAHDQIYNLNAGNRNVTDFRIIKNNGEVVWLRNHVMCINDPKTNRLRIYGAAQDITELKCAEKKLTQTEERFKTLIYNSANIIRILDKNGLIAFDAPSSSQILGYPEGSLIGKNPLDFVHPDDKQKVKDSLKEVYLGTNPHSPTEFRIKKADGEYLPVETVAQNMTKVPGIEGVVVTTHPIKDRKEIENALRESNEKYRTLFESDPNYNVLIGLDGKILSLNEAAADFIGITKEELIGELFIEVGMFDEENAAIHLQKLKEAIYGEKLHPYQCKVITQNGKFSWLESQLVPLKKDGDINSILIISKDVTERKIATDRLKASLNEKEVLLNEIHHRVKNNMQIISSLLNLQTDHVHDEESINVLKESQNRVKSMAMIHEKLYQSRDFTNIRIDEYIVRLVSDLFYSYNIPEDQIRPIFDVEDIELNLETAVPCGLIISELVSNCLKHAFPNKEKGRVKLSLKSFLDEYELIIKDDGIGFPENIDFKNTNSLGLQLVNSLVDQINGTIELNRSSGTEFKIIFEQLEYKNRIN
jgi:PAS domain S-box-containing protein